MWDDTAIFDFFDGTQQRFADPLEIDYALAAHLKGEVNKTLAQARAAHREPGDGRPVTEADAAAAYAASIDLVAAVRQAFGLAPFDAATGTGATWQVCLDALNRFVTWQSKKNGSGGREPTPCSAAAGPTSSGCPSPTSTDCGSTSNGPTGATPATSSAG